jgi:hypothetical protein
MLVLCRVKVIHKKETNILLVLFKNSGDWGAKEGVITNI